MGSSSCNGNSFWRYVRLGSLIMKTFIDWAGTKIIYEFRHETLHEDTLEKEFTCYIKANGIDDEWFPIGGGKTKEIAFKNAIQEWNHFDTVGRG